MAFVEASLAMRGWALDSGAQSPDFCTWALSQFEHLRLQPFGKKLATQEFTYTVKHGHGKITHGDLCVSKSPFSDKMILWGCDDGDDSPDPFDDDSDENLIWETDESKNGYKHISFPRGFDGSHFCINAENTKDGSPVTAVKCSSQKLKQQQWEITSDVRPTSIQVKLADSNKCLAVHNPSTAKKGSPVEVYDCASKADAEKQGQAFYYDVSHGGCFIRWVYGNKNLCVNALGGKHFKEGDAFGLFDCTYTKQEELQFMGYSLPTEIKMSASNGLTMVPKSCVGKWGNCNPPNGDKVVGTYDGTYWTRV